MARQDRAPRDGGARSSIYDDITSRIIAELEAGRLPWVQPWGTASAKAPLALPRNAATSRQYSGINILILWGAVVQQGYISFSLVGWKVEAYPRLFVRLDLDGTAGP